MIRITARVHLVAFFFMYSAFLMFDANVSDDFLNYQRVWASPEYYLNRFSLEYAYPVSAFLLNWLILDFRYFFLFLLFVLASVLGWSGRHGEYALFFLSVHPFSTFGFNTTILSYLVSMIFLVLMVRQKTSAFSVTTVFIHKGSAAFIPFFLSDRWFYVSLVAVFIFLGFAVDQGFGALSQFDVSASSFFTKALYVLFPLLFIVVFGCGELVLLRPVFFLLAISVLFLYTPKGADRLLYLLNFVVIFYVSDFLVRDGSCRVKNLVLPFWVVWSIIGYFHPSVLIQLGLLPP